MIEEIWKPVVGYEGLYEVSSLGRVRSLDRYDSNNHFLKGRILKLRNNRKGYLKVGLSSNGKVKKFLVHRLVAQAFIPNPYNLPQINHKDEDKTNNRVENLEMCDAKYNSNYGSRNIRRRETLIKNGSWTGLSRDEYKKNYYQKNRDRWKEYNKKNYQENKDKVKDNVRSYYQENRDRICEQKKEYRRKKKEQIQNNV